MIVGVDAGAIAVSEERLKVGVYKVCLNLLAEITKIDKKNTYRLYTFKPLNPTLLAQFGPHVENKVLSPANGWFHIRLPLELKLNQVDLFLGLSQAIPTSSTASIGWIYDLGFLHFPEAYPGSYNHLKIRTNELVKRSKHIITVSSFTKKDIIRQYNISAQSISVCYPGADNQFTLQGKKYKHKYPYFLFVGSLKRTKNLPSALKAFSLFLKRTKKIYDFIVIGSDKWLDPEITAVIETFNLNKRIHFLGFVKDEELPLYYRGTVAFVSPSLWEGFCIPMVEAMKCGCPVIGSNTSVMPEIADSAGIFVPPLDIEAIAKAMITIDQNRLFRQKLIKSGLIKSKLYSWEKFAQKIYKIIMTYA